MSAIATRSIKVPSSPIIKRIIKACTAAGFPPKAIQFSPQGDMRVFFKDSVTDIELTQNEVDDKWSLAIEQT